LKDKEETREKNSKIISSLEEENKNLKSKHEAELKEQNEKFQTYCNEIREIYQQEKEVLNEKLQ